jgi:hypothetical protein
VYTQRFALGLSAVLFGGCAHTPPTTYHSSAPASAVPKIAHVISDPAGPHSETNPEYFGVVVRFPTEVENVNHAVERTFTGFGAAIVKAINGQQSEEPPRGSGLP